MDVVPLVFVTLVLAPPFAFGAFCLLQLIRWINMADDDRHIRLLWVGLWSSGGGLLLLGIIMWWQVAHRLPR